ncbi:MAG: hypothetical protein ACI835_005278 [Planctomycetota bacterium]
MNSNSSTTSSSTTSTTDVSIAGTSVTPGAGDYVVLLSTTFEHTGAIDSDVTISIYVNGVQVSDSVRKVSMVLGDIVSISSQAHITVGAGEVIEAFWNTSSGDQQTMEARSMIVMQVN